MLPKTSKSMPPNMAPSVGGAPSGATAQPEVRSDTISQDAQATAMIPLCADLWLELDEQFAIIACDVQASVAAPHLCGTLPRHSIMAALGAELGRIAPQIRMGLRQSWPPQSHMLSILSEGEARRYLATFTRRDGGAGAIVPGYLAMLRDLSGATHTCDAAASTAQQATRIHLQSMLEALPDALALFDRDQRLVMCNNAYLAVFPGLGDMLVPGQSFADILKTGLRRGILPVTDCSEAAWIARQIRKFALQYSQSRLRALHGRWYREAQHPTPDGGRIIILSDVTDWKDTETRALEDRARALDASRDGVFLVSIDGKVQYANPAAIGILREDRREALLGQDWCALLLPCHPKIARDTVRATLAQAGFWQGQSFFTTEDDETVELESSVTRNADGTVLCVFRDITLQRLNEIERERLREQLTLARRREDIAQIAAGLAHDFNNILAGISAASSIIAEMEDIETAKPLALRISEACGQAGGLLKRMLSLGKTDTPRELLDLRRPLRDAESLLRPSLRAPVTLTVDLPQTPLMTYADSTALVQMALNLVINARDAILAQPVMRAEAGIRVALALATPQDLAQRFDIGTVDKRVSYARITVADDGPGLSAEMRANIFTPYFSTKGADGTGLGLAIVLSVIQKQGGAMALHSQPGRGTRFTILWPLEGAGDDWKALEAGLWAGEAVLVLGDGPAARNDLAGRLESAGALVRRCMSWDDLCQHAQEPDIWDCAALACPMSLAPDMLARLPETLPVLVFGAQARGLSGRVAMCPGPLDRPDLLEDLLDLKHKAALQASG